MERQKFQIECGRCGKTGLESLIGEEARIIEDCVGPVFRHCDSCEKTTGWIKAASWNKEAEGREQLSEAYSQGDSGGARPVGHGEERLATNFECDEVNS